MRTLIASPEGSGMGACKGERGIRGSRKRCDRPVVRQTIGDQLPVSPAVTSEINSAVRAREQRPRRARRRDEGVHKAPRGSPGRIPGHISTRLGSAGDEQEGKERREKRYPSNGQLGTPGNHDLANVQTYYTGIKTQCQFRRVC